ncbi:MAG: hypothetical protein P1V20_10490 [Verrucomicrobiales bacterium]|nr:hypothetical protein [Verrucomicrobiales bacterium]
MHWKKISALVCLVVCSLLVPAKADPVADSVAIIRKTGPEGAGSTAAAAAWETLSKLDASAIVPLLESMDGSGPVAKNWIRSALEVIFTKTARESPDSLPMGDVESFLLNTRHPSPARKLAFDLIASVDAEKASGLKPRFLNDPSPELRLDAVQLMISKGQSLLDEGKTNEATEALQTALDSARDVDQIKKIAKMLREKANKTLDLPKHFGFLMHWHVVGPFDNTDRKGFDAIYEPENGVDLNAVYEGKTKEVAWKNYFTTDEYGMVDFNQPYNPLKGVVGYAYTEFESDQDRYAQLRLGCKNAWKIWLNGDFVFGRDEYHRGMRIDQYQLPVQLKKGKNTILVKACQDEQEHDWTKEWQFQIRVCDETGTAILSTTRKPTPQKEQVERRRPAKP